MKHEDAKLKIMSFHSSKPGRGDDRRMASIGIVDVKLHRVWATPYSRRLKAPRISFGSPPLSAIVFSLGGSALDTMVDVDSKVAACDYCIS